MSRSVMPNNFISSLWDRPSTTFIDFIGFWCKDYIHNIEQKRKLIIIQEVYAFVLLISSIMYTTCLNNYWDN
jgi:hypothetical protein